MKKLIFAIAFVCLTAWSAWSATYYVDVDRPNDLGDGLSPAAAWKTIGKVNSFNFSSGDVILLQAGDIWTDATLTFTSTTNAVNGLTIRGSVTADSFTTDVILDGKPILNGNSNQPISISNKTNISSIIIKNIDVSGSNQNAWQATVLIDNTGSGLLIDGVDYDGHYDGGNYTQAKHNAIQVNDVPGDIEIRNCTITNVMKSTFAATVTAWGSGDGHAILFWYIGDANVKSTGTVSVHDNTISNVYSDCLQFVGVRTTTNVYNNTFASMGEQGVDIKASQYISVYENDMSHNDIGVASGAGYLGAALIVGTTAIDDFETLTAPSDNTIKNNYFHDTKYVGVISPGADSAIYGNYILNCGLAILAQNSRLSIYNNLIESTTGIPTISPYAARYVLTNLTAIKLTTCSSSKIYNNTIYVSDTAHQYAIASPSTSSGILIKNNILYITRNSSLAFPLFVSGTLPTISNNSYYNPLHVNRISWNGAVKDDAAEVAGVDANGISIDPGINIGAMAFYPDAITDAVVDAGITQASDANVPTDGLASTTDWTAGIGSMVLDTYTRSTYGGADIGAYEYPLGGAATGTITTGLGDANVSEAQIVAGLDEDSNPITIILTVGGTTWHANIGADSAQTTALIAGLDSAQSEAGGWDAKIKAVITHTAVVRDSDTQVTITIPPTADYLITANETITTTIPASCTASAETIVATPNLTVSNVDPPPDPPADPVTPTGGMAYSATGTLTVTFSGTGTLNIIIGSP